MENKITKIVLINGIIISINITDDEHGSILKLYYDKNYEFINIILKDKTLTIKQNNIAYIERNHE